MSSLWIPVSVWVCLWIPVSVWVCLCESRSVYGCVFVNPDQCMDVSLWIPVMYGCIFVNPGQCMDRSLCLPACLLVWLRSLCWRMNSRPPGLSCESQFVYVCMYVCISASLYLSVCVCLSALLPGCFSFEPITKRFTSEELTMVALPSPRVFPEVPRRCFRWPASPNHSFGNCTEVESVSPRNCLVF